MIAPNIKFDSMHALVRRKVERLVRLSRIRLDDREDAEQHLLAALVRQWKLFDRRRGSPRAFASVVVDRSAINMLRDRDAPSRRPPPRAPLDPELIQDRPRRTALELAALKYDVDAAVATLPAFDRVLAERLKHDRLSTVARQMNVPRSTLASRVRSIRQRFEAAGLSKYL